MSRMLLSIKPEYVNKIISGKKKYEFRKFHCRPDVDTIVIYATTPVKRVIGEASILAIIEGCVEEVWKQTSPQGGISKTAYKEYYKNKFQVLAQQLSEDKNFET